MIRNSPIYRCFIHWRPEICAYVGYLEKDAPGEGRISLKLAEAKVGRHGIVRDDDAFIPPMDEGDLKQFLQVIVDEAAKIGVVAGNARTETVAAGRHLEDMRRIVFHNLGIKDGPR